MGAERGWANSEPQLTSLLELRSLEQIIFFFILFIFGCAGLGLHCCTGSVPSCGDTAYSLVVVFGLLTAVFCCGAWALERRLSSCDTGA